MASDEITPRFSAGDPVKVKQGSPRHHCRTPYYCRGRGGTVERYCGAFRNPETLAYGEPGTPKQPLYRVRFAHRILFPDAAASDDVVEIELYEHWLESA